MKRLTKRTGGQSVVLYDILNRLAAIEDILGDDYDLDRLREILEADRDGRCVVLKAYAIDETKEPALEGAQDG